MPNPEGTRRILHVFADSGVECEVLSGYGEVTRIGIDPEPNPFTADLIEADARDADDVLSGSYDIGLFHPPCQRWSSLTHIHGDPEDHPDLIPLAREIGEKYCDHYIIENVPQAPLRNEVVLNGRMFGLPIGYKRAFETNYHVEQPPFQTGLTDCHDTDAVAGDWTGSKDEWKSIKGYSHDWGQKDIKRTAIPRAYISCLLRPIL